MKLIHYFSFSACRDSLHEFWNSNKLKLNIIINNISCNPRSFHENRKRDQDSFLWYNFLLTLYRTVNTCWFLTFVAWTLIDLIYRNTDYNCHSWIFICFNHLAFELDLNFRSQVTHWLQSWKMPSYILMNRRKWL